MKNGYVQQMQKQYDKGYRDGQKEQEITMRYLLAVALDRLFSFDLGQTNSVLDAMETMLQDEVVNDYIHSEKSEKFKRAAERIVEAAQQLCKEHGEHIDTLLKSRESEAKLEAVKAAWYSLPDEDRGKIVSVVRGSIVGVES